VLYAVSSSLLQQVTVSQILSETYCNLKQDYWRRDHGAIFFYRRLEFFRTLVLFQEIMPYTVFLVLNDGIQIDIFYTSENIGFHKRICLL